MNENIVNSNPRKVLFLGYGRAGKDEAAQFCEAHLGLRYGGSFSWHAKEHIAGLLRVHPMTAWENRHKNRMFWKDECDKLREKDQCHLARLALATGDICAGLRDKVEFDAVVRENLFDVLVWVDRPGTPVDPTVTFTKEDVVNAGGFVIVNDGDLREYHKKIVQLLCYDLHVGASSLSEYGMEIVWSLSHDTPMERYK